MASILWLPLVFASCSGVLYWLSMSLPALPTEGLSVNSTALKFPSTLEELQALAVLLEHYRLHHMSYVLALYSTAYLFKQAFAIPGSIFLNLLGGALFGQWVGFFLTCLLSASGATFCFLLAKVCGRSYIVKYFPDKLQFINAKIEQNADSLFFFLMFLRLFPMTPNWFLNMASPICGVPAHLFFLSVFFGLMPYNFISVQTGCLLSQLTSMDKVFTPWTMLKLFAMATAALVPGLCIKKYQEYRSTKKRHQEEAREQAAAAAAQSAQKVEVRSTKARKRLAFQARSKSTDEYRGGEVDPDFYNMLVDQHYAVRQKMQQVAEEKLSEAHTGYSDRTVEDQEQIAEESIKESEIIDDNGLQEGKVMSRETSTPVRTNEIDIDATNNKSDRVEELLELEPQWVEELQFSATAETNSDEESSPKHEEPSNSDTEGQKQSKLNRQRIDDVERERKDEASAVRISNGQVEEVVPDDDNKDLSDTLQDQEIVVDNKVEFCEDLPAEEKLVSQTLEAAVTEKDDIPSENKLCENQGDRALSAEQKLATASEEPVDAELKTKDEVPASTTPQDDDISTKTEPQQEQGVTAPSAQQELSTEPSEVDEETKSTEVSADMASAAAVQNGAKAGEEVTPSPAAQLDDFPTESEPQQEQVVTAPSAQQELSTEPSEVDLDEESESIEVAADMASAAAVQNGAKAGEEVTPSPAAQLDDFPTESEPQQEQVVRAPSAQQELPSVPSEVAVDERTKSNEEVAAMASAAAAQSDDFSTEAAAEMEQAPSTQPELSARQSSELADIEEPKTKVDIFDTDSVAAKSEDVIPAGVEPDEEEMCKATLAQHEVLTEPTEVDGVATSETKEALTDLSSSTHGDCTEVVKAPVSKPDVEDGANKGDKIPEDLPALNTNNAQEVELERKAENVDGKVGEGVVQDAAGGVQGEGGMTSVATNGEHSATQSAFKEAEPAPNGADCQDNQDAKGAKSPSAKLNGESLTEDKTEQSASGAAARTVIGTSAADSNSQ